MARTGSSATSCSVCVCVRHGRKFSRRDDAARLLGYNGRDFEAASAMSPHMIYSGSCHCGAIAFEVEAPDDIVALDCNCSICARSGFLHLIVPKHDFKLLRGAAGLTTYTFNTGVARHTFCNVCGVKPFYTPRSNPDGVDVNVRCLVTAPKSLTIEPFDGRNWEQNAASLKHLSE